MVSDQDPTRLTRRRWLAGVGLATAGVAGCVQSSGSTAETTRPPTETASPTPTATSTPTPEVAPASVLGGRLDDIDGFDDEIVGRRGESTVTVTVGAQGNGGNFAFDPAAVHVDSGTTVRWEWTGNAAHNVVSVNDTFESGGPISDPGVHYEYTFETDGVYLYRCLPHEALGMWGAVVVGDDYEPLSPTPTRTPDAVESQPTTDDNPPADTREFDGWLADVGNYEGVVDGTGHEQVTVRVGAAGNGGSFAFEPAAYRVDPGTTVQFEWTGEGGQHNVVSEDGRFDSGDLVAEPGVHLEHSFESSGVYKYYCTPHRALGMRAVIVVANGETTADA